MAVHRLHHKYGLDDSLSRNRRYLFRALSFFAVFDMELLPLIPWAVGGEAKEAADGFPKRIYARLSLMTIILRDITEIGVPIYSLVLRRRRVVVAPPSRRRLAASPPPRGRLGAAAPSTRRRVAAATWPPRRRHVAASPPPRGRVAAATWPPRRRRAVDAPPRRYSTLISSPSSC